MTHLVNGHFVFTVCTNNRHLIKFAHMFNKSLILARISRSDSGNRAETWFLWKQEVNTVELRV